MGIMTRLEMKNEVLTNTNRSDLGTDVDVWLYRAVLDLGTYHKFYENRKNDTLTLANASSTATVPTDMVKPVRLEYDDSSTISVVRFKDLVYVRENYSPSVTGLPDYFAREGSTFHFDRTSDQEYAMDLYYRFRPADYASDSTTSPYGGEWDEALILWATSQAFKRLREWQLAEHWMKMYYSYVKGRLGDVTLSEESYNETFAGDSTQDPYGF